jgi:large subunit ribosomal protein L4|uniref:Large ribosomal subunit protein uL4 n=1 Tax=Candidatus Caldatribacterium californiense TaxID=1454726 RepID=A0A7V4DDI9_9BACT
MELAVKDRTGQVVETVSVDDEWLEGAEENTHLLYLAVKAFLDNQRLGTAKTKTRGEVRGGGRKPWPQKGTGRARHGSIRSPIWRHGGIVFGPRPRSYYHTLSKKERRKALFLALREKIRTSSLILVEKIAFPVPKTKEGVRFLEALQTRGKVLIILQSADASVLRVFANIPDVTVKPVHEITTYFILNADWVVMEKEAFLSLLEVWGYGG